MTGGATQAEVGAGEGGREEPLSVALTRKSAQMLFLSDSAQPSFPAEGKKERKGNEKRRAREAVGGGEWLRSVTGSVVGFRRPVRKRTVLAPPNLNPPSIDRYSGDRRTDRLHKSVCCPKRLLMFGPAPTRPGPARLSPLRSAAYLNRLSG